MLVERTVDCFSNQNILIIHLITRHVLPKRDAARVWCTYTSVIFSYRYIAVFMTLGIMGMGMGNEKKLGNGKSGNGKEKKF
jgi:hypothetical protein